MVNFSKLETEDKSLAFAIDSRSKVIKKSKSSKPSRNQPKYELSKNTIVSLKCSNSSIQLNKNSYSNNANHLLSTTENFQPFSNFSLFPSPLQNLFQNPDFPSSELKDTVYKLKVPNNTLSFKKKIEKFRLLSLSQETFVQNYLKDKYQNSLDPFLLRDYYGYMKSKIQLNNQFEEFCNKQVVRDQTPNVSCWQNRQNDAFNKSYLCTPTTTFNESLLPEDILEAGAKELQVKYEPLDNYIQRNQYKKFYDFDEYQKFK